MRTLIDLDRFPINRPESDAYQALVERCRDDLYRGGMFNLDGFLRPEACRKAVQEAAPFIASASFEHRRLHNIYFLDAVPGLSPDHPALQKVETINHTVCADQIPDAIPIRVYHYQALHRFLAEVMGKPALYVMDDPLACANVMAYREGEALNWHFDRSEFTTTLLLQSPTLGGEFEYRTDLRTDDDPNYDGVAKLLTGNDPKSRVLKLEPGTLNVFRGKNTAHRVTPVQGERERIIAVFSYYEFAGKTFSDEENIGFYGRAS